MNVDLCKLSSDRLTLDEIFRRIRQLFKFRFQPQQHIGFQPLQCSSWTATLSPSRNRGTIGLEKKYNASGDQCGIHRPQVIRIPLKELKHITKWTAAPNPESDQFGCHQSQVHDSEHIEGESDISDAPVYPTRGWPSAFVCNLQLLLEENCVAGTNPAVNSAHSQLLRRTSFAPCPFGNGCGRPIWTGMDQYHGHSPLPAPYVPGRNKTLPGQQS